MSTHSKAFYSLLYKGYLSSFRMPIILLTNAYACIYHSGYNII